MIDAEAQEFIDAISPEKRALFRRVHELILEAYPDADVVLSYKMPTYKVGKQRLYVGVWKHGVSFYGWDEGRDAGFADRHPELASGKGTIRLSPEQAAEIADEELVGLVRAVLGGDS